MPCEDGDPYQVLGLPRYADGQQIQDAWRALAQLYHPDRAAGLPGLAQREAVLRFRQIEHAHAILVGRAPRDGESVRSPEASPDWAASEPDAWERYAPAGSDSSDGGEFRRPGAWRPAMGSADWAMWGVGRGVPVYVQLSRLSSVVAAGGLLWWAEEAWLHLSGAAAWWLLLAAPLAYLVLMVGLPLFGFIEVGFGFLLCVGAGLVDVLDWLISRRWGLNHLVVMGAEGMGAGLLALALWAWLFVGWVSVTSRE